MQVESWKIGARGAERKFISFCVVSGRQAALSFECHWLHETENGGVGGERVREQWEYFGQLCSVRMSAGGHGWSPPCFQDTNWKKIQSDF